MTKLQLAQKRNYFKFVLSGMYRFIDPAVLTPKELDLWNELFNIRFRLIEGFDENSKLQGLKVPEHRCWCGKEAKNFVKQEESGIYSYGIWVCNKHKKED